MNNRHDENGYGITEDAKGILSSDVKGEIIEAMEYKDIADLFGGAFYLEIVTDKATYQLLYNGCDSSFERTPHDRGPDNANS